MDKTSKLMDFIELQEEISKISAKKASLAEFGRILDLSRSNISLRARNNSEVTVTELQKLESFYGVSLYKTVSNSGERQNDTSVDEKSSQFGKRLSELQEKHNFLDREMATLLKISEKEYLKLVVGKLEPNLQILNRIKQNFKISIDYLLYGE